MQDVRQGDDRNRVDLVRVGNLAEDIGILDFEFALFFACNKRSDLFTLFLPFLQLLDFRQFVASMLSISCVPASWIASVHLPPRPMGKAQDQSVVPSEEFPVQNLGS